MLLVRCNFAISTMLRFVHRFYGVWTVESYMTWYEVVRSFVRSFVRPSVRPFVRPSVRRSVAICTIVYYEQTAWPRSANFCIRVYTLTRYFRLQIFILQTIDVLDLLFKGQRFESSTLRSSAVIISQTVTYRTNVAVANTESRMWPFDLYINIWPWTILKVRVKNAHFRY